MIVKGVSIRHYANDFLMRGLISSIVDSSITNSGKLKCSVKDTRYMIKELKRLINGEISLIEGWGDEQIYINSEKEISHLEDLMYGKTWPSVPTIQLLKLMEVSLEFQLKIKDLNYLAGLVKKAYTQISQDSTKFKIWPNGNFYRIIIDDISINLQLIKENGDFELTPDEYLFQIPKLKYELPS